MAIIILPDAQEDLLSLQEYMLNKWSETDWLNAENEIFEKLALVATGLLTGAPVQELACVGIFEYQTVFTSHHKLVYRRINDDVYVYAIAGHRQDYPTLLMKRLLKL
ncbi:MAG: type II toxin-antitoxin system RelE/ParE family toxin [Burkholderiales bacterium]